MAKFGQFLIFRKFRISFLNLGYFLDGLKIGHIWPPLQRAEFLPNSEKRSIAITMKMPIIDLILINGATDAPQSKGLIMSKDAKATKAAKAAKATKADANAIKDAKAIGKIEDAMLDANGVWIRKDADGKAKAADRAANGPGRIGTLADLLRQRDAIKDGIDAAFGIAEAEYDRIRSLDSVDATDAAGYLGAMASLHDGCVRSINEGMGRLMNSVGNSNGNFISRKSNNGDEFVLIPTAMGSALLNHPEAFARLDDAIANCSKAGITNSKRIKRKRNS